MSFLPILHHSLGFIIVYHIFRKKCRVMQEVHTTIVPYEKIPVKDVPSLVFCLLRHLSQASSTLPGGQVSPIYRGEYLQSPW